MVCARAPTAHQLVVSQWLLIAVGLLLLAGASFARSIHAVAPDAASGWDIPGLEGLLPGAEQNITISPCVVAAVTPTPSDMYSVSLPLNPQCMANPLYLVVG